MSFDRRWVPRFTPHACRSVVRSKEPTVETRSTPSRIAEPRRRLARRAARRCDAGSITIPAHRDVCPGSALLAALLGPFVPSVNAGAKRRWAYAERCTSRDVRCAMCRRHRACHSGLVQSGRDAATICCAEVRAWRVRIHCSCVVGCDVRVRGCAVDEGHGGYWRSTLDVLTTRRDLPPE
jgi:hypothetical protein